MSGDLKGEFFLLNKEFFHANEYQKKTSNIKPYIYEVIRIIDGIPLFCEEHFERMERSLNLLGQSVDINYQQFEDNLKLLSVKNQFLIGNIKISIGDKAQNIVYQFLPHYYPTEDDYSNGVKTSIFKAERINPHVKAQLIDLKKRVNEEIKSRGVFELVYENPEGIITEGSKSNLFFIKDEKVYTCIPEMVLLGITRKRIIECINELQIPFVETKIYSGDLTDFEAAFISGTSPKVLPIATIDEVNYSVQNETMGKIMNAYNQRIEDYLKAKKSS